MDKNLTPSYQPHPPTPITLLGSIMSVGCLCLMALWLVLRLVAALT